MGFNIAIDGPAGAGKSTIAKRAAKELQFIYVDTGAMYRAIGYYLSCKGICLDDEAAVSAHVKDVDVTITYRDGEQQVFVCNQNVSSLIRNEKVGAMASKVSAYAAVRNHLLDLQRKLAKESDVLMDGRDIGTCILPNAEVKIYLTADPGVRAKRRCLELEAKGVPCNFEDIKKQIIERDYQDMNRAVAPLKQAEDAVLLDSSDMTIDEVVEAIVKLVQKVR